MSTVPQTINADLGPSQPTTELLREVKTWINSITGLCQSRMPVILVLHYWELNVGPDKPHSRVLHGPGCWCFSGVEIQGWLFVTWGLAIVVWHVYIIQCVDQSLYTGVAKDVEARVEKHNAGCGAKYTRSRRPVELVYQEPVGDQSAALRRELAIKRMERAAKRKLIDTRR